MAPRTWTFPSSSGGKDHITSLNAEGILTCSCPGWKIKKPGKPRQCDKHMGKLIREQGWTVDVVGDLIRVSDGTGPVPQPQPSPDLPTAEARARAPMMASAMTKRLEGEAFDKTYAGWSADLKIDGHRRMVEKRGALVQSWSYPRDGEPPSLAYLPPNIVECFKQMPDGWYDGEYAAVGIGSKSWDASRLDTEKQFYVFDVLEINGTDVTKRPYYERRALLELACQHAQCPSVVAVPRVEPTWASVQAVWASGAEGLVLKQPTSQYTPGVRSASWVKVKALEHHVVTITGFEAGSYGPCSVILATFADGVPVRMKTKNNDWLRMFEQDPQAFIGRKLTMECQLRTKDGSARHPMCKELILDHLTGGSE